MKAPDSACYQGEPTKLFDFDSVKVGQHYGKILDSAVPPDTEGVSQSGQSNGSNLRAINS